MFNHLASDPRPARRPRRIFVGRIPGLGGLAGCVFQHCGAIFGPSVTTTCRDWPSWWLHSGLSGQGRTVKPRPFQT